jgi:integrase
VQYYVNGKRIQENTRTRIRGVANDYLKSRLGRAAEGRPLPPRLDKILYDELAGDLREVYQTSGDRDLKDVEKRLRPLDAYFTGWQAMTLDEAAITKYVAARQASKTRRKKPPAAGTINRELSILGTMLRLAERRRKLLYRPPITLLKEAAPRSGFFEAPQYQAVRRHLRPDLQLVCDLGITFGFRVRDEVLTLRWAQIDLAAGTIRLNVGETKSGEGRLIYLTEPLRAALQAQRERVDVLQRARGQIIPHVFVYFEDAPLNPLTGRRAYQAGARIQGFRRAWRTACKRGGCPGMLLHDLRRTAVRNLVNDGTPEKVAMTISGHKTRSVFDRYHIVAPEDLRAASVRIAAREFDDRDDYKMGGRKREVRTAMRKSARAARSS